MVERSNAGFRDSSCVRKAVWRRSGALVIALALLGVYPAGAAEVVIEASAQDDDETFQGTGAAVVFTSDTVGYSEG